MSRTSVIAHRRFPGLTLTAIAVALSTCIVMAGAGCDGPVALSADVPAPLPSDLDQGYHKILGHLSDGRDLPALAYIPTDSLGSSNPLIIVLHGAGIPGPYSAESLLENLVAPAFEGMNAIFLAPDAVEGHWALPQGRELVNRFRQAAIESWPVDPNRVILLGFSMGGTATWALTELDPDPWSSGIVIAGEPYATGVSDANFVPKYIIHGSLDQIFPISEVEARVLTAIDGGAPLTWHPLEGVSHGDLGAYVPALAEARTWLEQLVPTVVPSESIQ